MQTCLQQPGRVVHETRIDLALDPGGFLAQTWDMWQPVADMGRVQNQAVGYLFPMGPFFFAGHVLNVPTWLIQRFWVALLLIVALWGAARLADELRIGKPWTRVIGATAFALAPIFLARVGTTSGFVIGGAFLPWALVPLVQGSRTGKVRSAACLSALAVLAMGGVNASVTAAVLVMPALFLVTRERSPIRARLIRWWCAAVTLACAWWFLPLLLQSAYGADFLSITERASTITAVTGPFEVVRGTADWLAYYSQGAALPAGFFNVSNGWAILATGLVAAAGLAGLSRTDLPERKFLAATALVGIALLGAGYGGPLGNPFASLVGRALDGPLSSFRTLYKLEPIIALALALGFAHLIATATDALAAHSTRRSRWMAAATGIAAAAVVLVAVTPLFTQRLLQDRGFEEVPSWWQETADHLETTSGRALLVPGLPQSDSTWGYTEQEPLQWLTTTPWATRSIAPLGGRGSIEYLDTVEAAISRGGDPQLVAFLRRAGFSTMVVRNDAEWARNRAPNPVRVNAALMASGLEPAASFGPPVQGLGAEGHDLQQIQLYAVPDAERLVSYPVAGSLLVSGGTDSLLAVSAAGLGDRAAVLASDLAPGQPVPPNWVVTDGNQRRYIDFGRNRDNRSYLLSSSQDAVPGVLAGQGFFPGTNAASQTTAYTDGVAGVRASSYGARATSRPEVAPVRALDGDPTTAWVAGGPSTGEWLEVDFDQPTDLEGLSVELLADGPWRPEVESLRVSTDRGEVVTAVEPVESRQVLAVPSGPAQWVRVTFDKIDERSTTSTGAGIRELIIPGVDIESGVNVPTEFIDRFSNPDTNLPTYLFTRFPAIGDEPNRGREEHELHRRFRVPRAGTWSLGGTVAPVPSQALLDLIDTTPSFAIRATSTRGDLPEYAPRNLVDDDAATMWVAATTNGGFGRPITDPGPGPSGYDPAPTVTMHWEQPRTVDRLTVGRVDGYSSPFEVTIAAGDETRIAQVPDDGVVDFAPLTTNEIAVTFTRLAKVGVADATRGRLERPLALSELRFDGLEDLTPPALAPDATFEVTCTEGPTAEVGQVTTSFAATVTFDDLISLRPVTATPCSSAVELLPGPAALTTSVGASSFRLDSVQLFSPAVSRGEAGPPPPPPPPRKVEGGEWGSTDRTVDVAPGAMSYLVVNENFNKGWVASLDGESLEAIRSDGWRQGFVVPAGNGGTVDLHYRPTTWYRGALVLGLFAALLLIGLTVVTTRRERHTSSASQTLRPGTWSRSSGMAVPMLVSGVVAGPVGLIIVLLWFALLGRRDWLPWISGSSFALATIWAGWTREVLPATSAGIFGSPPNLLALLAILTLAATVMPDRRAAS